LKIVFKHGLKSCYLFANQLRATSRKKVKTNRKFYKNAKNNHKKVSIIITNKPKNTFGLNRQNSADAANTCKKRQNGKMSLNVSVPGKAQKYSFMKLLLFYLIIYFNQNHFFCFKLSQVLNLLINYNKILCFCHQ
jgi:hypothetical protein